MIELDGGLEIRIGKPALTVERKTTTLNGKVVKEQWYVMEGDLRANCWATAGRGDVKHYTNPFPTHTMAKQAMDRLKEERDQVVVHTTQRFDENFKEIDTTKFEQQHKVIPNDEDGITWKKALYNVLAGFLILSVSGLAGSGIGALISYVFH